MKSKTITLLVTLLAILVLGTACSAGLAANDATAGQEINLIAYASRSLGLSGLVPEGWIEVKPGHFQPTPGSDPTLLAQAAFPGATGERVIAGWQLPERAGSVEGGNLSWDLYRGELAWPDAGTLALDIALAEADETVYFVVLVTPAAEQALMHETVMVPVLQALAPASGSGGPATVQVPATMPAPAPVDYRIRPADGMTMVYVPAGEFAMGNDGIQWMWNGSLGKGNLGLQVYTDESPQHDVYLDAYWIDQTEVTVAMFRTFVEATGYETAAEKERWGAPYTAGPPEEEWPHVPGVDWQHPHGPASQAQDEHPVVQVTWDDAAAYCQWAGGQLPTEAQWEKAARGTGGRLWPWGNDYDGSRGNFCDAQCPVERWRQIGCDDGYALTAPVSTFPEGTSPYGAHDVAGNVWEWVADWYGESYYDDSVSDNPTGPAAGRERVQRGGAWLDHESWVRTTVRHSTAPTVRCDDLGFRCAVPAE